MQPAGRRDRPTGMKADDLTHPLTATTRPLTRAATALACGPGHGIRAGGRGLCGVARQGRVTGQGALAGSGACDIAADSDRQPRGESQRRHRPVVDDSGADDARGGAHLSNAR
jgi:hypothetical protein